MLPCAIVFVETAPENKGSSKTLAFGFLQCCSQAMAKKCSSVFFKWRNCCGHACPHDVAIYMCGCTWVPVSQTDIWVFPFSALMLPAVLHHRLQRFHNWHILHCARLAENCNCIVTCKSVNFFCCRLALDASDVLSTCDNGCVNLSVISEICRSNTHLESVWSKALVKQLIRCFTTYGGVYNFAYFASCAMSNLMECLFIHHKVTTLLGWNFYPAWFTSNAEMQHQFRLMHRKEWHVSSYI